MKLIAEEIFSWFAQHQPEMQVELIPPGADGAVAICLTSRIIATGRYTIESNGEKYGYDLSIVLPTTPENFFIPVVFCVDEKLYPALNRHILSNRQACLGTNLDVYKVILEGGNFADFAKKVIDPFIAWQLHYDTFGGPPPWGERAHGFDGDVQSIAEHLSEIWGLPVERFFRMLTEYKPQKRKKCFCGSGKQFRHCHGKYFYPIRQKITKIKGMTPDEYKRDSKKTMLVLVKSVLELPALQKEA